MTIIKNILIFTIAHQFVLFFIYFTWTLISHSEFNNEMYSYIHLPAYITPLWHYSWYRIENKDKYIFGK